MRQTIKSHAQNPHNSIKAFAEKSIAEMAKNSFSDLFRDQPIEQFYFIFRCGYLSWYLTFQRMKWIGRDFFVCELEKAKPIELQSLILKA